MMNYGFKAGVSAGWLIEQAIGWPFGFRAGRGERSVSNRASLF